MIDIQVYVFDMHKFAANLMSGRKKVISLFFFPLLPFLFAFSDPGMASKDFYRKLGCSKQSNSTSVINLLKDMEEQLRTKEIITFVLKAKQNTKKQYDR